MKKILNNNYLLFLARFLLGFIFIYAAVEKINDPGSFAVSINNYKLLPIFIINIISVILPWIELTAGMLLVIGISVRESSFITSIFLLIFIFAVSISLLRGLDINCGCFGTAGGSKIGIQKIVENLLLLILSVYLFFFGSGSLTLLPDNNKNIN
ncbi:MAG TPA: MauE/DoxX family redox-associated membrane protein [Ignavibacteriaceae bacterium]|nr:MauE/DoxX family redox-associated membrane protein [Ignavibacteriaceae bacterium]